MLRIDKAVGTLIFDAFSGSLIDPHGSPKFCGLGLIMTAEVLGKFLIPDAVAKLLMKVWNCATSGREEVIGALRSLIP